MTLIFSLERYRAVINAFQSGLEQAKDNGHDLSKIHSVASFFVSRVDTEIDKRLDAIGTDEAKALKGKAGLANARLAYQVYEELFATERWALLAEAGALPAAPAVGLHRREGPGLPGHPLRHRTRRPRRREHHAGEDPRRHVRPRRRHRRHRHPRLRRRQRHARTPSTRSGISYNDVVALLESEGLDKFVASWKELLGDVEGALAAARKAA